MNLALKQRLFHTNSRLSSDFSHIVIGGGIVGIATAAELQEQKGNKVLLVEKHSALGQETTSRNSEVIHAGLYYPPQSLKAKLCIEGKNKIYDAWSTYGLDLQKCGKWVVAQNEQEQEYLVKLEKNAKSLNVPVKFISTSMARKKYPLIKASSAILESPTTGIISAHEYVMFHQGRFENNEGTLGLNTKVKNICYNKSFLNYSVTMETMGEKEEKEEIEITGDNVVNAGGLFAAEIANMILPKDQHYNYYFAKGNYFSYTPEKPIDCKITDKLIYPCPNPNASSLGTHLTFDLGGQLRFGPDLEWLNTTNPNDIDYTPNPQNLEAAYNAIKTYLPAITQNDLAPSYSGVRPKILSPEQSKNQFADFIIREQNGFPGFVNLLGIESPGLTAAWAIAEHIKHIYHQ
ncbi:hypothetical protein KGF56_002864 [Candida oxycetoniae]|uniref:L-2-hydroxyglutarate dehydrogenase, mitochondrial n=1 Tax=Candida oxycetoniae TaxID=497107 RepID=A0AAI9SWV1_9ASCO|nr:uncharacterized protein KGF56_002864 [Candida oxycetoniae]KAI3404344.1 hypothetical protein KGF56_002864 [Candida oxycetoniae]